MVLYVFWPSFQDCLMALNTVYSFAISAHLLGKYLPNYHCYAYFLTPMCNSVNSQHEATRKPFLYFWYLDCPEVQAA